MLGRDRSTVILGIHPARTARIFDGSQTIEFRRKPLPDHVEEVLILRTGGWEHGGGIVGRFYVARQELRQAHEWTAGLADDEWVPAGGVRAGELREYARGVDAPIAGIHLTGLERLPQRLDPRRLHATMGRAPRAVQYPPADWRATYVAVALARPRQRAS